MIGLPITDWGVGRRAGPRNLCCRGEPFAHVALSTFTNYMNSVAQTAIDFPEVALATA